MADYISREAAGVAAGVVGHGESQNVPYVPDGTEE